MDIKKFSERPPLTHLKRLTTKDGIIQHADHEVPDPSFGYSIDDNARALIACLWHYQIFQDPSVLQLGEIYFNYIKRVEKEGGSFHNFLSFTDQILDSEGSEDSIARAVWAMGVTSKLHPNQKTKEEATAILSRTNIDRHETHAHLRTHAYLLLGLLGTGSRTEVSRWEEKLVTAYQKNRDEQWRWFEGSLRYANAILPYALTKSYLHTKNEHALEVAEESFLWLDSVSRIDGKPAPIGQEGWWYKGHEKAEYDQQPLEAADMVLAACALYETTQNEDYKNLAVEWMSWYYGSNVQDISIFNEQTGGVFDGITPNGVNKNQGAESIVTFLMAHLSLSSHVKS
jgi:hypothetical protein